MPKNSAKVHELEFQRAKLDEERTRLANERTSLAYLRTAVSFAATGLLIIKFFDHGSLYYLSVFLIVLGAIFFLTGLSLYPIRSRRIRAIRSKLNFAHYLMKRI